jgi:hypothetical protein
MYAGMDRIKLRDESDHPAGQFSRFGSGPSVLHRPPSADDSGTDDRYMANRVMQGHDYFSFGSISAYAIAARLPCAMATTRLLDPSSLDE